MGKTIKEIRERQLIKAFNNKNIDLLRVAYKTILIDFYSSKKVNLCYAKRKKPIVEYVLITNEDRIIHINKTIYYHLTDIKTDLTQFVKSCTPSEQDLNLYNRFKDSDYMHLNFLKASEKNKIKSISLFLSGDYNGYLEGL